MDKELARRMRQHEAFMRRIERKQNRPNAGFLLGAAALTGLAFWAGRKLSEKEQEILPEERTDSESKYTKDTDELPLEEGRNQIES